VIKRAYKALLAHKKNSVSNLRLLTTRLAEDVAIVRKRKLYADVVWTKEQQEEFDRYWIQNYGKKIPNMWHKLYQHYTHRFNVEYIPEKLYTTKIEPFLNPYFQAYEYQNKGILELLISDKIAGIARCPKTYVVGDNGILYGENRNVIEKTGALAILKDAGDVVIKPTKDSSSGKNICILNLKNGKDLKTGQDLETILNQYQDGNFIAQEKLKPSEKLAKIYPKSINTFRVITYTVDGEVYTAPIVLRIGVSGNEVDNIHAGGLCIHVDDNGILSKEAFQLGYGTKDIRFSKHPDSGLVFDGYRIDEIPSIIKAVKIAHGCMVGLGIISWDVTLDLDNIPVIIEANIVGQSVWFPQIVSGEAIFEEHTMKILQKVH